MKFFLKSLILFLIIHISGFSQTSDTLLITPKNLRVSNLKEGNSRFLVYFKKEENAPISDIQIWNLETKKDIYNGKNVISVYQRWEFKDSIIHTAKSVCLGENFKPLYHESWWKQRGKQIFDVEKNKLWIDDVEITSSEANPKKNIHESFLASDNQYYLNWHLDLEVFSMLPYKKNVVFLVPFYEFGYDIPRNIVYKVSGEDEILFNGERIKCWLLKHKEEGNEEVYWISKKTNEVLKMVQKFGKMYRYKIKLPLE